MLTRRSVRRPSNGNGGKAVALCFIMVVMTALPLVQPPSLSTPVAGQPASFFTPGLNATGVNLTSNGMLSIPANETFLEGRLDLTPTWTDTGPTGHRFGIDTKAGWNGTHNGTQGLGHGGQLSLAPQSTLATLTDFETLVETLPDWEGQGPDHAAWNVHVVAPSNGSDGKPTNATTGQRVLATQAFGGLVANMSGCLASPSQPVPAFVSRFNLSFDHWLSLADDDAAWVEWRATGGAWQTLFPIDGYTNASSLNGVPSTVWAGQTDEWQQGRFTFDPLLSTTPSAVEVRVCFQTSATAGDRNGWYLDNFTFTNQGDEPGAWFHGNMTGSYANNADGRLYVLGDVSGTSGPLELEFWANWDIEGAFADNLLVSLSVNNGSTWQTVSGIPGLPGNGYTSQGTFLMDESLGWVPVTYNLPTGLASHPNASSVLFEFHVQTNHQTGFGGFASSGWEGIAIDDIVVHHRRGTAQAEVLPVANFTNGTSGTYGDEGGWLEQSTSVNEWVWTTAFGMNGPETASNGFEASMIAPPGWVIEGTWPDGWEIGATRNTSGYGPGQFHSGTNGAAINLTTKYTNNVYTHLVTQEYAIPTNATARLAFQSWVCTEANWDGGGVSISNDGGLTWWWLPPDLKGFHDQISTVNTNSPLFGEGILDGSSLPNGCSTNKNRPFDLKTYDLSNLSGQSVKARFSFFSDTFVEADGWYIDDAGIEIDVFEHQGAWTSQPLAPDPLFGYGWLDGWYTQPAGTNLSIDLLDAQLNPINGHTDLRMPALLALDPVEHPSIHVRVNMATNDTYVTPLVHSMVLGRTVFIGPSHVLSTPAGANASTLNGEGHLMVHAPFSYTLPSFVACPHDGYRITNIGDNLSWGVANRLLTGSAHLPQPVKTTYLNYSLSGGLAVSPSIVLSASGGEHVERSKMEFDCVRPTIGPSLQLGWGNISVLDWPPEGMSSTFGLNTRWSHLEHNATTVMWNTSAPSPSFALTDERLTMTYHVVEKSLAANVGSPAFVTFMASNVSQGATVSLNGVLQTLPEDGGVLVYATTGPCPSSTVVASFSMNFSTYSCQIEVNVSGSADIKPVSLAHLAGSKTLDVDLNATTLNAAKAASDNGDVRALLNIPLHVQTVSGGLRVGLVASTLPLMTEFIQPPEHLRWLPGETVTFTTHHQRTNPLDPTEDAPDIVEVELRLARTTAIGTSFVHLHVDQLSATPRFRQFSGVGLAQLVPDGSSVSCSTNSCSVTWALKSTWLLDDVDDIHLLTQATDEAGMSVGPSVFMRQTPFNEVENDLEVTTFTVTDTALRRLDDWTNSFWPYHLGENTSMVAQGRVRIEGIADEWIEAGEAEATVTLRAVPPKNASGGPDTWPGVPVNWTQTWSSEIGEGGWFSIPLSTPSLNDGLPSNTWLEITPSLSRRGPAAINASTSEDRTVVLTPTRVLYDITSPRVESLEILDFGRVVPADEHVVLIGRNLPLRLQLSDLEGLDNAVDVWLWREGLDDANGDGVMDASEYSVQQMSINRGVKFIEVDLPLVASTTVLPTSAFSGRLSVVVKGQDLAGNPLVGGGTWGEANDLATVHVHQRADTTVEVEDITLDTVGGRLLAGHEHVFSYALADANGFASLDRVELALFGDTNASMCFIHYEPRFGEVSYDDACFIEPPLVNVVQRSLSTIYDVTVRFRLNWTMSQSVGGMNHVPSLVAIDEGQDLGLGLHHLNALTWTPSVALDMRWEAIVDTVEPVGQSNESTRWYHRNDLVHHQIGVFHRNTTVLARDVPTTGWLVWELNDGERRMEGELNLSASGSVELNITMNENVMYHDHGNMSVRPVGFEAYDLNGLAYNVVLDDRAPKLVLSPGTLERLNSNELEAVEITVSVNDDTHMPPGPLRMHSVFYRMGQPLEGTQRVDELSVAEVVNAYTVYDGTVNFLPSSVDLTRSDILVVWFEAVDRSGRPLTGLGTATAPLNVGMTWVAFEPVFTDVSAKPYRPQVGDNVVVYVRVANEGLLPGETAVVLRDDEGRLLASQPVALATGEWVNVVWNVEAWKQGRLGLTVQLENHTPAIPVPLADIQAKDGDDANSSMAVLSLSVLAIVVAGAVLLIVNQKRAEREEVYHLERIRRIVSKRAPPPVPWQLVDTPQEE